MTKVYCSQMEVKHVRLKNDRKAPRFGKAEFTYHVVSKKLYSEWKKENPKYEHYTYKEFKGIWDKITQEIHNQVVTNEDGVRLPFYNGDLKLKLVITNLVMRDQHNSLELQKEVKHLNWNTNKKPAKICWTIKFAQMRNKWIKLYGSAIDRKFSKKAYYALQDHPEIFSTARVTAANAVIFDKIKKAQKDAGTLDN